MGKVVIPYKPRRWARRLHDSWRRWAALVLHRRAGKTTAIINHHIRAACDNAWEVGRLRFLQPQLTETEIAPLLRGRFYGHIMPTRTQAKTVAWDMLKYFTAGIPGALPNESELLIRFPNGNKVQLFGADNPDSLRGPGFSGLSFDEYSQQPRNIFSEVLSKGLADHLGYAIFAGTIKGRDHLYATHEAGKENPGWFALWQDIDQSLATEEGVTLTLLRQAMTDDRQLVEQGLMTQDEFDQEWYLSAEAAIRGAIFGKELAAVRLAGHLTSVPYDPALPVDTDWDLGVGDSTAIWFSQSTRGGEVRLIDYYEASGEGLPHYAAMLQAKGYTYGTHGAPHDIVVKELGSGRSRLETARSLGLPFRITKKLSLEDGIHAARLILPRCWFDAEKCQAGLRALLAYRWDFNARLQEFKPTPLHDWSSHAADAFRGLAVRQQQAPEETKPLGLDLPGSLIPMGLPGGWMAT